MKWIELKFYLYSRFIEQIKAVEKQYISIVRDIEDKPYLVNMKEFDNLRQEIKTRIGEIDSFIEQHFDQEQVLPFEKGRVILRRLITIDPNIKQTEIPMNRKLLDDVNDNDNQSIEDECPCYNRNVIVVKNTTISRDKSYNWNSNKSNQSQSLKMQNYSSSNSLFSNNSEKQSQSKNIYDSKKTLNTHYTFKNNGGMKNNKEPLKKIKEETKCNKIENHKGKNDFWLNDDEDNKSNQMMSKSQSSLNISVNNQNDKSRSKDNTINKSMEEGVKISNASSSKSNISNNNQDKPISNKKDKQISPQLNDNELKELSLCFKLNEAEYRLLQKEKAKRVFII